MNCYECKYLKYFITKYCSKQNAIVYHPDLQCIYAKKSLFSKLMDILFPPMDFKDKSENVKP